MLRDIATLPRFLIDWITPNILDFRRNRQHWVWGISIIVGILVAGGAIIFRLSIGWIQLVWLGKNHERIASFAAALPPWLVVLAPALGGLVVGLMIQNLMPGRRAEGVADVIEAQALGLSRLTLQKGVTSSLISAISIGAGASVGREGPIVHLGASLSAALGRWFDLPGAARRTILGAGVAAAVSASFNAPIAGAIFAHEIILGHYALSAFVPITLSSVIAAVIARGYFGDFPAFVIPHYQITSYWEVPAFALLGLTCAAVAILFQFALMGADHVARRISIPLWLRPVIGGAAVGVIAIAFPQVLGVGYEATSRALNGFMPLNLLLVLIVLKTLATAICLASRFGGGVFSPALYIGAMTGGAFGLMAASVFPHLASSEGLYTILGMGAVAAAVLGAPFSTTLIVFELTGGFALSLALLVSVAISTGLTQAIHGRSFFQWQLETRGLFLREGPHKRLVRTIRVRDFLLELGEDETPDPVPPEQRETALTPFDTLEKALRHFDTTGRSRLPVVDPQDHAKVIGWAPRVQALAAYNAALIETSVEEHR
ncbi:MAG: chloride channel protein [Rhodobiaceae bacterium]|nr:chloride channel protein [Rhodobiaceae bacterium]